ncbi:MAG TPA: carbon starvation CstA family protein [Actinomycetota bacterium]|nr:carbon starvation CstA family protein [Actinomycetota bacterium]
MRALVLNCTLELSPAESDTEAPARVVTEALEGQGVTTELVRAADDDVRPRVSSPRRSPAPFPFVFIIACGALSGFHALIARTGGAPTLAVGISSAAAWTRWRSAPAIAAARSIGSGQATQVVSQGRHHQSFRRLVRVPSLSGL